ncbi:hypothetical protein BaRGS_00034743, partial [Batillaria attramentaria]
KELAEKGEEDIEQLLAEFVEKDKRLTQVTEEKCPPPSPRCNMTLVPHPDKDELIMFGGEYFTGNKMYLYNDLFFYNIRKNEWTNVASPQPPPPRSAHQAVTLAQSGGQMWVFGGEFSSHTQNQFYHYRDLWVLHLKDKRWEQIKSPGGPSARSGHRMAAFKKQLIVFGGFHENMRDYRYFNDVYAFDLDNYTWSQLQPSGLCPSPRSGCVLFPTLTCTRLVVYGGYSRERVKRDVDKGTMHTDMYALQPEGKGEGGRPAKWRWVPVKQSGVKPSPRSSMSAVVAPGNRGVLFGGVFDEEDEEQLEGTFFNDMFSLDLDKGQWFSVQLRGSRQATEKKRRRKAKPDGAEGGSEAGEGEEEMDVDDPEYEDTEENLENLALSSNQDTESAQPDDTATASSSAACAGGDDIFTVTIGPQSSGAAGEDSVKPSTSKTEEDIFVPCGRMKPCLAVKDGVLYLYGGTYEVGDKQMTLADFHALDLGKLDEWQDPDSSSDEDDDGSEKKHKGAVARKLEEEEEDDSGDDDEEMTFDDAPPRQADEGKDVYFERTQDYWLTQARSITESEGMRLSDRKLLKFAKEICDEACST